MEKRIRGGICHPNYLYVQVPKKYINEFDEIKELFHLKYWNVINLHA